MSTTKETTNTPAQDGGEGVRWESHLSSSPVCWQRSTT